MERSIGGCDLAAVGRIVAETSVFGRGRLSQSRSKTAFAAAWSPGCVLPSGLLLPRCSVTIRELVAKMKRFRIVLLGPLAVFAAGAVMTSAAQAVTAPFWSIQGTRLLAGRTHNLTSRIFSTGSFVLETPAFKTNITCTALTTEKGVLLGSEPGRAGAAGAIVKFSGCSLGAGENGASCKLKGTTITTKPLRSQLVDNTAGTQLLELFRPASGSEFAKMEFEGECIDINVKVTGSVAAEVLTDPGGERITLGEPLKEGTSWLTKFPGISIANVSLVNPEDGKEEIVAVELEAFTDPTALRGTALVSLANHNFIAEEANWSPLP